MARIDVSSTQQGRGNVRRAARLGGYLTVFPVHPSSFKKTNFQLLNLNQADVTSSDVTNAVVKLRLNVGRGVKSMQWYVLIIP